MYLRSRNLLSSGLQMSWCLTVIGHQQSCCLFRIFFWIHFHGLETFLKTGQQDLQKRRNIFCELNSQSLATNSPAPAPRPLTYGVSSECLGTRSYETTSRDQRGKIQMFFSSTGAFTAAKFPIANHHSEINTQLYSASLIRLIWQQRHSDSEFDAL